MSKSKRYQLTTIGYYDIIRFMMELESSLNKEVMQSKYDCVLVHGYWMSQSENGITKLSEKSEFMADAAGLLYKNGISQKFVISIGHLWGESFPALNDLIADRLINVYSVPKENIIVVGDAKNTEEEIEGFLEVSNEKGLENLANVAFYSHFWSMQEAELKHGIKPMPAEEIIFKYGNPEMKRKLIVHTIKYGGSFVLYNAIKRFVGKFKWGKEMMMTKSHTDRSKKGNVTPIASVDGYVVRKS